MSTVRQRTAERLVRTIGRDRHPSHHMLERLERSLRTREDIEAYAWLLDRAMQDQRHPSPRLLDRLDRAALVHELLAPNDDTDDDKDDE